MLADRKILLAIAIAILALSPCAGAVAKVDEYSDEHSVANASASVDKALAYARAQSFGAALAALDRVDPGASSVYEIGFARARILAWAGRYDEADAHYAQLLREYPEDPDIRLGHAYLAYYQGDLSPADTRFASILVDFPEYEEARRGLERVRKARRLSDDEAQAQKISWRLDSGAEISTFQRSPS